MQVDVQNRLSENMVERAKTPAQRTSENLQRFRKCSDVKLFEAVLVQNFPHGYRLSSSIEIAGVVSMDAKAGKKNMRLKPKIKPDRE